MGTEALARAPAGRDAHELLAERGVAETWRRSIAEALALIDLLDERLAPLERELHQLRSMTSASCC